MNKNILNLTKFFIRDIIEKFDFFNIENKKFDKKNYMFWLLIIVIFALSFLTYKIINPLIEINQQHIFLNIFFTIISIINIFQLIIISSNTLYFSNDLKILLPLPLKPKELLIAKLIAIIVNMYILEAVFILFPLIIYGIMTFSSIFYYFYLIIILLIFPILPTLIVSIIISFFMNFSKLIKNKNIFQFFITILFIVFTFFLEYKISTSLIPKNVNEIDLETVKSFILNLDEKTKNINKIFIQVNDITNTLKNQNFKSFINILKILIIDTGLFFIFINLENKYYIKNILKNNNYTKIKKYKKFKIKKYSKKRNKKISYLIKEIKVLFRNPTLFIQSVFPILILTLTIFIITFSIAPQIRSFLEWDMLKGKTIINYDINIISKIIIITQMIFTTANISITGISREGKKWILMKNYPMKLYDQFKCKSYIQTIFVNIILIAIIFLINKVFFEIKILDLIILFILLLLLNIINSKLMLLIDLINPNLNWDAEYEINKNNKNKIFQYGFTVIMILIISYFSKISENVKIYIFYLLLISLFLLIIFIINFIVKLNIENLFNKIKIKK